MSMRHHILCYTKKVLTTSLLILSVGNVHAQYPALDSMKHRFEQATTVPEKVDVLIAISWSMVVSQPDSAANYAQKALALSEAAKYDQGVAQAKHLLGTTSFMKDDYATSMRFLNEALLQYKSWDMAEQQGRTMLTIGSLHCRIGQLEEGLKVFLELSQLAEANHMKVIETRALNNIGFINFQLKRFDEAVQYYKQALQMNDSLSDAMGQGIFLTNIGTVFYESGELDSALVYFEKASELSFKSNDLLTYASILENIGTVYKDKGRNDLASRYLHIALGIFKQLGNNSTAAKALSMLGELKLEVGQTDSAIYFLDQALVLAEAVGERESLINSHQLLSKTHATQQDFIQALHHHRAYKRYSDSLYNATTIKNMDELMIRDAVDRKEKELSTLRQQEELDQLRLAANRRALYLLVGGLLLAALTGWWLWWLYGNARKDKRRTDAANEAIREIEQFRDNVVEMIVTDLEQHTSEMRSLTQQEPRQERLPLIRQHGLAIQMMVSNLLDLQKFEEAGLEPELDFYGLRDAVAESIKIVQELAHGKALQVANEVDPKHSAEFDQALLTRSLANVLLYGLALSNYIDKVTISSALEDDDEPMITLQLQFDNAQKRLMPQLFDAALNTASTIADTHFTLRLGMQFCQQIIEAHDGILQWHTLADGRFVVEISLHYDEDVALLAGQAEIV